MSKDMTPQQAEALGDIQEFNDLYVRHPKFEFTDNSNALVAFVLHQHTKAIDRQTAVLERQAVALETLASTVRPDPHDDTTSLHVDASCMVDQA